jgi:CBS domain-containing protein
MTVKLLLKHKGGFVPVIRSGLTLNDVIEQLRIDEAGALVVTDDKEKILGIITERDIARGLQRFGRNVVERPLQELMTRNVVTVDISERVNRVLELMDRHQIHYVPVTDHGLLVGIITMLDIVRYRLAEMELEANALKDYVTGRHEPTS